MYQYNPRGICARTIYFDITDGKVYNVQYVGGCDGNHKGIASLVEGMPAEEVVARLKGIDCHGRGTSCPDQLAKAVEQALQRE